MNLVGVAALGSAIAALIHAAAAGSHGDERELVLLFGATAIAQAGWAAAALVTKGRGQRPVLIIGAVLNGAAVAAWVLSRTTGLPVIDALAEVEEVGTQDLAAAIAGTVAAVAATLAAAGEERLRLVPLPRFATALAAVGATVIGFAGMTAAHTHGEHAHGDTTESHAESHAETAHATDGEHTDEAGHTDGEHTDEAGHTDDSEEAASGPIISVDDERVTPDQRAAAQQLIDTTRAGMARFTDEAAVEAAGYRSIGDGLTGHEHFVNPMYLADDAVLDPERIESIVLAVNNDGTKEIVSAMYILPPGQTMADVPDIAGELTTWHDHQNLCWNAQGQIVGLLVNGRCRPSGVFRPTPPMLHVWMVDHPCGPFAGLDGHGGECEHAH